MGFHRVEEAVDVIAVYLQIHPDCKLASASGLKMMSGENLLRRCRENKPNLFFSIFQVLRDRGPEDWEDLDGCGQAGRGEGAETEAETKSWGQVRIAREATDSK